ncbi:MULTISPECIES: ACT domain-containing protein [Clostridioides]|uniref:ACT domain-containing protein n=1 Tax=unclassified Clostridioides TaxID=2635829 RepID=UPI001D0CADE3|nr:ACT domain-containing protein [Clostridioides sp. ZZV15-6388]MCC0635598.1 ACT domain-containing protein [Clostridioides sp. ES-S-0001-02]MCC0639325.1 ACT domain-containing protein [Clostridioides sp. ES-S-0049-03]MCC0643041.1 ACT domain-containing protein [Clostridioides sp. ZZV14-6150]MCC0648640.1 ACT domain-containing protein [Clostridioides sp. ZZV15-6598]MCC0653066.1 ACT domain-containing protein [Clostridioides sp. ES-S-0001-03]MCC0656950.1 ACT domain-containing protein [Clostridioide
MRAILTVIGKDKPGIVAGISDELYKQNINIVDISQKILQEYFTMIMVVDLEKALNSFEQTVEDLIERGKKLSVDVKIQREEIFNSMHNL